MTRETDQLGASVSSVITQALAQVAAYEFHLGRLCAEALASGLQAAPDPDQWSWEDGAAQEAFRLTARPLIPYGLPAGLVAALQAFVDEHPDEAASLFLRKEGDES